MDNIKIITLNKVEWTEQQGISSKGKRVKGWYEKNISRELFLYKEPKTYESTGFLTPEIWTEFIAYKIGEKLNLNIPQVMPTKNIFEDDKISYGVLIKSFINPETTALCEIKEILYKDNSPTYHNLKAIKLLLNIESKIDTSAWTNYIKMLIFDTLIGNSDRHSENWGLCLDLHDNMFKLAPIYDNASCLTYQLADIKITEMLENSNLIENYIIKSKPPNLFIDSSDTHKYNHYELIQYLLQHEIETKRLIKELLDYDYIDYIDDIMKKILDIDVPRQYKFSDNRRKVILKILKTRKNKLRDLL